jgi:S1-C subfamily serine protease
MSKGIPIVYLIPGCHAERAGVRAGDIIISVNGNDVNSLDDYADAIKDRKNTQKMIIVRDGISMDIECIVGPPIDSKEN